MVHQRRSADQAVEHGDSRIHVQDRREPRYEGVHGKDAHAAHLLPGPRAPHSHDIHPADAEAAEAHRPEHLDGIGLHRHRQKGVKPHKEAVDQRGKYLPKPAPATLPVQHKVLLHHLGLSQEDSAKRAPKPSGQGQHPGGSVRSAAQGIEEPAQQDGEVEGVAVEYPGTAQAPINVEHEGGDGKGTQVLRRVHQAQTAGENGGLADAFHGRKVVDGQAQVDGGHRLLGVFPLILHCPLHTWTRFLFLRF